MFEALKSFKGAAWVIANWHIALALFGAASLALTGTYFLGRSHGYDSRVAEEASARAEAEKLEDESAGEAAVEREQDRRSTNEAQEGRDNAIEQTQADHSPSDASNALNCERLRAAGADLQQFSACR